MRRVLVSSVIAAMVAVLAFAPAVATARPTTTSYPSVTCWVGWEYPTWRFTGHNGQVEHDSAVITTELWVYTAGAWQSVGTQVETVRVVTNYVGGSHLYRGSFVVTSTLGDFAGSFVWVANRGYTGGQGNAVATDGSGQLWKQTPNAVDPSTTGVPACATEREIYNLMLVEITKP